jgi:hypothetical protein
MFPTAVRARNCEMLLYTPVREALEVYALRLVQVYMMLIEDVPPTGESQGNN